MRSSTAGWSLKCGALDSNLYSEDDYWELFNAFFSPRSMKRNSYKFALIKSILDSAAVCTENNEYKISYNILFEKFTHNYWNLVCKFKLKQMRKDGKSEISKIESVLLSFLQMKANSVFIEFDRIDENEKKQLITLVEKNCKQYVIGALYQDFEGKLYGFEEKGVDLVFNKYVIEFLIKYKKSIQIINYYYWAKFLEEINPPENTQMLLDKLELATPMRSDLSKYRKLLLHAGEHSCFYCGKALGEELHVDHFIPWSFMHDDNLWNFVLACPKCNIKKKDKIAKGKMETLLSRNLLMSNIPEFKDEFKGYSSENHIKLMEYALKQGYKEIFF